MSIWRAVDTALDRSIVLGYGRLGLWARRRLPDWPADPPRMDGSAVLVTGAASGLGLAAARRFAQLGAAVHALARDPQRAEQAAAAIRAAVPSAQVRPQGCDLSSLAAVKAFAEGFAAHEPRLDVVVNNAGVMPPERTRSVDGHELMFATHVLAPLALVSLLSDLLARSAPARVINVGSGGMYGQSLPVGDWESDDTEYGPKKLYARTKREQVAVTEVMADRLRDRAVLVYAMHPGWADTEGVRRAMPTFRVLTRPIVRTADEGADTIVWLGATGEATGETGRFWHDRRQRPTHYRLGAPAGSARDRAELWAYCESALAAAGIGAL